MPGQALELSDIIETEQNQDLPCNYRKRENYSMQAKCKTKNALCKCIASTPTKPENVYLGISVDEWKKCFYNYTKSFRMRRYKDKTPLVNVWKIDNKRGGGPASTWTIMNKVPSMTNKIKSCAVCLHEKLEILLFSNSEEI